MSVDLETRPDAVPTAEVVSLALVDTALARAAHRRVFTRDEAIAMLQNVRASVGDPAVAAEIAVIVEHAIASYDDPLLAKAGVVDTLLDMRLALTRLRAEQVAGSGGDAADAITVRLDR